MHLMILISLADVIVYPEYCRIAVASLSLFHCISV